MLPYSQYTVLYIIIIWQSRRRLRNVFCTSIEWNTVHGRRQPNTFRLVYVYRNFFFPFHQNKCMVLLEVELPLVFAMLNRVACTCFLFTRFVCWTIQKQQKTVNYLFVLTSHSIKAKHSKMGLYAYTVFIYRHCVESQCIGTFDSTTYSTFIRFSFARVFFFLSLVRMVESAACYRRLKQCGET